VARQDALGKCLRRDDSPAAKKPDATRRDAKKHGHVVGMSTFFGRGPRAAPGGPWFVRASSWFVPCAIAAVAAFCLAGGIDSLWHHWRAEVARLYRAPSGVVLIAAAFGQFWIARAAWRSRCATAWISWPWRGLFWRWLLVGALACYAAALALGPDAYVRYLFRAALACWYTLILTPLVAGKTSGTRWRSWLQSARLRRAGHWAFALSLAAVLGEGGLRLVDLADEAALPDDAVSRGLKLSAGSEYHGREVNAQGYWDDAFEPTRRPGRFRVAVLGGSATLSGTPQTNCLDQLEARVPGIEIYNFGLPRSGLWQYAAQLERDVVAFQPDLVMAFFTVGQDVTEDRSAPSKFDWRSLRSLRLAAAMLGLSSRGGESIASGKAQDFEAYLSACSPRVRVCRTPTDEAIEHDWQTTRARLTDLVRRCHRQGIEVALVVVPEDFQVNPIVFQALRRRLGYEAGQLDLELPQRRLARLTEELELPTLDLLPYFRAAETGTYSRDEGQWNDRGNQVAGEAIGGWLQARFGATILAQTRRGE
jgi:hypothetical protein